jgi:hypothetical protein
VVREFDLVRRQCVEGGFQTSVSAKCDAAFRTRDEVLIGTDFEGDGSSLTDSGYPRVVKSWRRGTPLSEATTVFEAEQSDISASQYCYHDRGHVHEFQMRSISFYASQQWYRSPDLSKAAGDDPTPFRKVPVPDDTTLGTFGDQATVLLRSAWAPPKAGREFAAGTLLTAPLASVLNEDWSQATALFEPDAAGTTSLQNYCKTANYVVLQTAQHVRSSLAFYKWDKAASGVGAWRKEEMLDEQRIPVGETVGVRAVWPDDSDEVSIASRMRRPFSLKELSLHTALFPSAHPPHSRERVLWKCTSAPCAPSPSRPHFEMPSPRSTSTHLSAPTILHKLPHFHTSQPSPTLADAFPPTHTPSSPILTPAPFLPDVTDPLRPPPTLHPHTAHRFPHAPTPFGCGSPLLSSPPPFSCG